MRQRATAATIWGGRTPVPDHGGLLRHRGLPEVPTGRVLAMVFAHPDDDAYSTATPETLAAVRRQEDQRAWQVLGRSPDRHEWLGYPDGRLAQVPFEDLVAELVRILGQERPDVVVAIDFVVDTSSSPIGCGRPCGSIAASGTTSTRPT